MMTDGRFWFGVGVGVTGVWAWHRWVRPLKTAKNGG